VSRIGKITRRTLLVGSVAVAGGVAVGYWMYRRPYPNPLLDDLSEGEAALTPYVRIDGAGVTIIAPRAEMGQGVHTTLAALVAEELDVALEDIRVEHGPASHAYYNAAVLEEGVPFAATDEGFIAEAARGFMAVPAKFLGMQLTGGSSAVPDAFVKMRTAGAAARAVLIEAAARRLGLDARRLGTMGGAVVAPDGTRLAYTALALDAAGIEPPSDPPLKHPAEWRLLGKPRPRVDMVAKCTGTAEYAIDVRLPGMLHATVRMNPRLGGPMNGYDATAAEGMPGVKRIVPLDGGVAVVATNTWYAFQAADAVSFDWGEAPYPATTEGHFAEIAASFTDERENSQLRNDGDVDEALTGETIEIEYRAPYLAHATMEPMNAVAHLIDGRLDIWAGNQNPTQARAEGAALTGLEPGNVHVHTPYMGGGFGRRSEMDFIKIAVEIARAMKGVPVKTTWSRIEDTGHDFYRPAAIARVSGKVADGRPVALDIRIAGPSPAEGALDRLGLPRAGPDTSIVQAAWDQPYGIPHYRTTGYRAPRMLPVGFWRSVGASQNAFFHESAIDEMAIAAGADPLEMRLALMTHDPSRKVLEAVARMSGWGGTLPEGHGRGVAFCLSFGVPVAEVVEVTRTGAGLRIASVFAAVDVGTALDPRNIEAQVISGVNFGLSAAMTGEITIADGMVEQSSFHDFDPMRMGQDPSIEVAVLENGPRIRGIGEPGTPPAAPALANAIYAATGQRIRELPLGRHMNFA